MLTYMYKVLEYMNIYTGVWMFQNIGCGDWRGIRFFSVHKHFSVTLLQVDIMGSGPTA